MTQTITRQGLTATTDPPPAKGPTWTTSTFWAHLLTLCLLAAAAVLSFVFAGHHQIPGWLPALITPLAVIIALFAQAFYLLHSYGLRKGLPLVKTLFETDWSTLLTALTQIASAAPVLLERLTAAVAATSKMQNDIQSAATQLTGAAETMSKHAPAVMARLEGAIEDVHHLYYGPEEEEDPEEPEEAEVEDDEPTESTGGVEHGTDEAKPTTVSVAVPAAPTPAEQAHDLAARLEDMSRRLRETGDPSVAHDDAVRS